MNSSAKKMTLTGVALSALIVGGAAMAQVNTRYYPSAVNNCVRPASYLSESAKQEAIRVLSEALRVEIAQLPDTASAQDVEAAIAFTLSQANAPAEVVNAALDNLANNPNQSLSLRQAVANARLAVDNCTGIGTAALGNSGSGILSSTPVLGVGGGGSANYTTAN